MPEVGIRVALNRSTLDDRDRVAQKDAVGYVVGHIYDADIVALDHRSADGRRRIVIVEPGAARPVVVAHPGKSRRTKPRRQDEVD